MIESMIYKAHTVHVRLLLSAQLFKTSTKVQYADTVSHVLAHNTACIIFFSLERQKAANAFMNKLKKL